MNTIAKNRINYSIKNRPLSDRLSMLKNIQNRWNPKKGILMLKDIKKSRVLWD